jgi:ATP-grasp domain, R2K clade family 3
MIPFLTGFADELVKLAATGQVSVDPSKAGAKKKDEPSILRRIAPVALGLGAGYGAFRLGRRIRYSSNPELARIQRASKGRLTHVEALEPGQAPSTKVEMLRKRFLRGVDEVIEEPAKKWKKRYEHFEYPAWHEGMRPSPKAHKRIGKATPVEGAVMTMGYPSQALGFKGDINLTKNVGETLRLGGSKIDEAAYVNRSVKDVMPQTKAVQDAVLKAKQGGPKSSAEVLDRLQADLSKRYPNGYVIKPINEAASGGVPTHKDRFAEILAGKGNQNHQLWMQRLLKSPDEFLVQEYIPIKQQRHLLTYPPLVPGRTRKGVRVGAEAPAEWRAHVVGGQVVPGASVHRWAIGKSLNPVSRAERKEMEAFLQKAVDQLPASRKGIPMGVDVAKDAKGKWRIIELNAGGESNYLRPDQMAPLPGAAWATAKAITGRQSVGEAAVKGTGAALGVGGASHLALRERDRDRGARS